MDIVVDVDIDVSSIIISLDGVNSKDTVIASSSSFLNVDVMLLVGV